MSEDWKIQVSPKSPSGTLINIRGNTPEEISALIGGIQELVVEVVALEKALGAVTTLAPLSTGTTTAFPTAPPISVQAPPTAPASSGPTCVHGARKYVTGKSARGPWQAWMCPTPKDSPDKCDPVWA